MQHINLKRILIALLLAWLLLFSIDAFVGIAWPNYTAKRIFTWTPTVLIGLYWLLFGGSKKE